MKCIILFTCQNSLEYIERYYNPYCDERIACNFYPISSQSYIKNINDRKNCLSVMA